MYNCKVKIAKGDNSVNQIGYVDMWTCGHWTFMIFENRRKKLNI